MDHISTTPEKPSEFHIQSAYLKDNYGEKNTAKLITIFSTEHPNLTTEEVVNVIYTTDMKDVPRSTSWPDTTLDRILIFR